MMRSIRVLFVFSTVCLILGGGIGAAIAAQNKVCDNFSLAGYCGNCTSITICGTCNVAAVPLRACLTFPNKTCAAATCQGVCALDPLMGCSCPAPAGSC